MSARNTPKEPGRPFILILSYLYPRDEAPVAGLFVQRYAHALSRSADVSVISVLPRATGERSSSRFTRAERDGVYTYLLERAAPEVRGRLGSYRWLWWATVGAVFAEMRGVLLAVRERGIPSVVNPHFTYPSGITASLLRLLGWRYVITEHSTEFTTASGAFMRRDRLIRWLMSRALRKAARVTVVSRALERAMRSHGLEFESEIVPNIVDPPTLPEEEPGRRIVSVSLMRDRAKNISGLLRAIAELRKTRDGLGLDLIGDGLDRSALEQLSAELGLEPIVVFHGLESSASTLETVARSAFLVTNSNFETFSVVTAEAIACGRPVVATRCGGPEEYVTPEVGMLIDPGDHDQLVGALDYMLDHCQTYDRQVLQAYARALFSSEVVATRMMSTFRQSGALRR